MAERLVDDTLCMTFVLMRLVMLGALWLSTINPKKLEKLLS